MAPEIVAVTPRAVFPGVSDGTNEKWHLQHEEIGIYGAFTTQNWDLAPGADGSGTLQPILVGFQRGQPWMRCFHEGKRSMFRSEG